MPDLSYTLTLDGNFDKAMAVNNAHLQAFHSNIAKASSAMADMYKHVSGGPGGAGLGSIPKHLEEAGIKTREVREALHLLGDEFGEVGMLAHSLGNEWLLAAAGGIIAFKMISDQMAITRERLSALAGDATSRAAMKFSAIAEAGREITAGENELARSLNYVNAAEDKASIAMTNRLELFNQMIDAQKLLLDAQESLTESSIDQAQATGRLNALQAMEAKDDAKLQLEKRKNAEDNAKAENEIAEKKKRRADAYTSLKKNVDESDRMQESSLPLRASAHDNKDLLGTETTKLNQLAEDFAKATGDKLAIKSGSLLDLGAFLLKGGQGGYKFNLDQAKTAGEAYNTQFAAVEALKATQGGFDEQIKDLEKALANLSAKAGQDKSNREHLATEIAQDEAKLAQARKSQADLEKVHAAQNQIKEQNLVLSQLGNLKQGFEATSLEKMGFHFGAGGPTALADHSRSTAQSAAQLVRLVTQLVQNNRTSGYGYNQN